MRLLSEQTGIQESCNLFVGGTFGDLQAGGDGDVGCAVELGGQGLEEGWFWGGRGLG